MNTLRTNAAKPSAAVGQSWSSERGTVHGRASRIVRIVPEPPGTRPFEPSGVAWFDDGRYATFDVLANTDFWTYVGG